MPTFTLHPRGPFSLAPLREMQCGFLRGTRACDADPRRARIAFPQDGDFAVVGATVTHRGATVEVEAHGPARLDVLRTQVARTLGLDHDGDAFQRVLRSQPALAPIAAARPGFRPPVAYSPYVMGGWALLSQRLRMAQAAALQVRLAEAAGDTVELGGQALPSFPRPQTFLARSGFPGIPEEKWRRLQVLARAALEGELEVARLTARPYEETRERLMKLRGVGPWTADAMLLRGVGPTDALPLSERSLHRAVAIAYGRALPLSDAEVEAIAEDWRPFRMWVSVLLISHCSPRSYGSRVSLSRSRERAGGEGRAHAAG